MKSFWSWSVLTTAVALGACSESEQHAAGGAGRTAAGDAGGGTAGRTGGDTGGAASGNAGTSTSGAGGGHQGGESGTAGESSSAGSGGMGEGGDSGREDLTGGFSGGGAAGGEPGGGQGGDGAPVDEVEPRPIPEIDESALAAPVARGGFVEIAPVTYTTLFGGSTEPRTSVRSRLFYNLLPADDGAKQKPVFVVFNGGPGAASSLLRSFGTGKRTLDSEDLGGASTENPVSLTQLGSVLYIDCRQAGYSYGLLDDPSDEDARRNASNSQSVNEAFDAADFVRVVLRVLALEPALKNNPVVLVGESYGGVRAPLMLYLVLNAKSLSDPAFGYYDPELGAEVVAHATEVFELADTHLTPRQMAKQFGWQVLLEPLVGAKHQFARGSLMRADALAAAALELGISIEEAEARCNDDVSRTQAWCEAVSAAADRVSLDPAEFRAFTGLAPSSVARFAASERAGAFRFIAEASEPDPDLLGLGALPGWDRYYLPFVGALAQDQAYWIQTTPYAAGTFVYSAAYAETLVTNARYDMNVIGASIVPALRDFAAEIPSFGLTAVGYDGADPDMPTETIRLELAATPLFGRGGTRLVHFPSFPNSGHYVSVSEPERLHATIAQFLAESGLGED